MLCACAESRITSPNYQDLEEADGTLPSTFVPPSNQSNFSPQDYLTQTQIPDVSPPGELVAENQALYFTETPTAVSVWLESTTISSPRNQVPQVDLQTVQALTFTAQDDFFALNEDSILTNIDVLANDLDQAGNIVMVTDFTQSRQGGMVTLLGNGLFQYVPPADFYGQDWFSYVVSNSLGESRMATVNLSVLAVDDKPRTRPDSYTVPQNLRYEFDVLANDSGLGDGVYLSVVNLPINGTLTFGNGRFRYLPNVGFTGVDSFIYRVVDSDGDIATANVTFTVECTTNCSPEIKLALSWQPSPSPGVVGYRLYVWDAALSFLDVVELGNVTRSDYALNAKGQFFFAISSVNSLNMESDLSKTVSMIF